MSAKRLVDHAAAALPFLCGVAALLGLFTMHGLVAQGAAHQAHHGGPAAVRATEHQGAAPAMGDEPTLLVPVSAGEREHDPGWLGLTALCLAVLLLAVVRAVVRGRGAAVADNRALAPRAGGAPPRARRDRDPPRLHVLSIQRC